MSKDIKKWTQDEVNASLWRACDTFRRTMDSSQYKDYILVMLFVKYLSDIYTEKKEELMSRFDNDVEMVKRQLRYERFVLDDEASFDYIYNSRTATNIGEIINKALANIEEANKSKLRGVFRNIDFNSEAILGKTKERNSMLRTMLEDFNKIDLRPSRLIGEDIIGNSYEFLISNFASDAGKKGGEFFTPSKVSELLAKLVNPQENDRIYDPTCGSGSLLIKAFQQVDSGKAQIYGQESNGQTHSLARMNMFLHDIDDAKIEWGDTISNPLHLENDNLMKFQAIVANPPFSLDKWYMGFSGEGNEELKMEASLDPHGRFDWGIPPKSRGDYAFIQHMLKSLSKGGRMGVVLPHGVLFRGGSEGKIRKKIVDDNLIDAVIGLPENLFFGVTIPTVIIIFKNGRERKDVLFIDASQEDMFEKSRNQNKLRDIDIDRILKTYNKYEEVNRFSYISTKQEIIDNDYNLNIPRYVDTYVEGEPINLSKVKNNIKLINEEIKNTEMEIAKQLKELGV